MCGIIYKSNYNTNTDINKFISSTNLLKHRGLDDYGYIFNKYHSLGHNRFHSVDNDYKQPLSSGDNLMIMDGYLSNYNELSNENRIDSLLIFNLLNEKQEEAINSFNGGYSIVYISKDKVLGIRDRFGIKPLYYSLYNNDIIIASEIKAIINYTNQRTVDKDGLCELLGMGPSHSIGKTIYKNIYEVPPGCYIKYEDNVLLVVRYYDITDLNIEIPYGSAIGLVKKLVDNVVINNIPSDKKVSCLLSGGLDSSIISTITSKIVNKLDTYLIEYENKEEFISNEYEISNDNKYAKLVSNSIKSNHHEIKIKNEEVFNNLLKAVDYKDGPGMTDIDSSLIYLAENISKDNRVCLTGECADEIFAGYRWYYKESEFDNVFPWINSLDFKEDLLNDKYKINLKEYVLNEYNKTISNIKFEAKYKLKHKHQIMSYINIKYFMTNLLDRNDRMTMSSHIESKAPFCDYNLIDLLFSLPLSYKYRMKTEKKLLRDCFKREVIKDIIDRKKSPYPKAKSKIYDNLVKDKLLEVINQESIINELFNKEKLLKFINDENEMEKPWYGQLMRKTAFLAYLYQIDYWYKKYNIRIEI